MTNQPQILTKALTSRYRGLKQVKNRKEEGLFLLEGVRLCQEAFNSKLDFEACIIGKNFDKLTIPDQLILFEANQTQLEQISDSKSPQGIICIAKIPSPAPPSAPTAGRTLLVLDRMADPGNMGTIFRSALWFGVTDILIGPDCVDPFSPKVVRSSMGAITSLNIQFSSNLIASAQEWKQDKGEVIALHMTGTQLKQYQPHRGLFLVVGSEAHGVAPDLLALCHPVAIEKQGAGESLNAAMATAIALYELNRH